MLVHMIVTFGIYKFICGHSRFVNFSICFFFPSHAIADVHHWFAAYQFVMLTTNIGFVPQFEIENDVLGKTSPCCLLHQFSQQATMMISMQIEVAMQGELRYNVLLDQIFG